MLGGGALAIERVGSLNVDHEIKAADPLDVWVDDQGIQVAAPTPTWRAGIDAVLADSSMGERRSGRCRAIGMDPRAADSSALHRLGPRVGDASVRRRRWPNRVVKPDCRRARFTVSEAK